MFAGLVCIRGSDALRLPFPQADDDKDVKMASKIVRSEAPQRDTGINGMDIAGGSGAASRPRRSSLDNLTVG